MATIIKM